jgi:hypothetical protein
LKRPSQRAAREGRLLFLSGKRLPQLYLSLPNFRHTLRRMAQKAAAKQARSSRCDDLKQLIEGKHET